MDDEDARCLLDVICDPQALNDFLHGSEKIDSDDLLDSTGDAASAFFEGAGLHMQEPSGSQLNTEQSPPATSLDFDFLEDILGSPSGGGTNLQNSDWPCDILQQSLQEANITEQMLKAEAELDLGPFQLPTLQPVVQAATNGTLQIFSGRANLIRLQQPAGPIQVVGQPVMAINQSLQQIKQVQLSRVATVPVGSYITLPALPNPAPQQKQRVGRFQQVPQGIILQQPPTSQASAALCQFTSPCSSILVSGQGQAVRVTPTPTPEHGQAPTALPPSTADEHISSLSCSQSLWSSSSSSSSSSSPSSSSLVVPASSSILLPSQSRKHRLQQPPPPIHPTKVLIKHSGGSPSLTGAKASPVPDSGDGDALPSRSKLPIKTPHEAQSCIRLNLKVRQEAGRIKVVHSTVVYPVYQRPARRRLPKGPVPTALAPAGR